MLVKKIKQFVRVVAWYDTHTESVINYHIFIHFMR
jgi:hypothetical protein